MFAGAPTSGPSTSHALWLSTDDPIWDRYVESAAKSDFYHSRGYNKIEADRLGGRAELLVVSYCCDFCAIPLILRDVPTNGASCVTHTDATSSYGYPGPIFGTLSPSSTAMDVFRRTIECELKARGVVALFSRLHPLIDHQGLCSGLGNELHVGYTISIDLTLQEQDQLAQYRSNVRRSLRRALTEGLELYVDHDWMRLDQFKLIYYQTLLRVGAANSYFYDDRYFDGLRKELGSAAHLLFCMHRRQPIGAALFVSAGQDLVNYHLGGSLTEARRLSPSTFLFDAARKMFSNTHAVLHLGGGVGGRQDSLFHFKSGFSDRRHPFRVWRWIVAEDVYRTVCHDMTGDAKYTDYFPAYRTPR